VFSHLIPTCYRAWRFIYIYISLTLIPILNKTDPVYNSPAYVFKIHFNIILQVMPWSCKRCFLHIFWSELSTRFLFQSCLIPHPFHTSRIQILKPIIMQFSSLSFPSPVRLIFLPHPPSQNYNLVYFNPLSL